MEKRECILRVGNCIIVDVRDVSECLIFKCGKSILYYRVDCWSEGSSACECLVGYCGW